MKNATLSAHRVAAGASGALVEQGGGASALFQQVNGHHALGLAVATSSSAFWTLAYVLIVRRAARDRTFAMPLTALGANLSWEVIFLVTTVAHGAFDVRLALLVPWTLLDGVILVQTFRYGARDFASPRVERGFAAGLLGIVATTGAVLFAFVHGMRDAIGWYAAFGQNLMMSALFVAMFLRRDDLRGQSVPIAGAKLLGTFFAFVLAVFWSPPSLHEHWAALLPDTYTPVAPLLVTLYAATLLLDASYVALLVAKHREVGVPVWSRW